MKILYRKTERGFPVIAVCLCQSKPFASEKYQGVFCASALYSLLGILGRNRLSREKCHSSTGSPNSRKEFYVWWVMVNKIRRKSERRSIIKNKNKTLWVFYQTFKRFLKAKNSNVHMSPYNPLKHHTQISMSRYISTISIYTTCEVFFAHSDWFAKKWISSIFTDLPSEKQDGVAVSKRCQRSWKFRNK